MDTNFSPIWRLTAIATLFKMSFYMFHRRQKVIKIPISVQSTTRPLCNKGIFFVTKKQQDWG